MIRTLQNDEGQTLPLFIVAAGALLLLAFALFAVGQAAVHRNSTQSAADAAALAAAQEARDEVTDQLKNAISAGDLSAIVDLFSNTDFGSPSACAKAQTYAAKNGADVTECHQVSGPPGYSVSVVSQKPLGKTQVEGTEDKFAKTDATAVIEPKCSVSESDGPTPADSAEGEGAADKTPPPVAFKCDDGPISLDPGDLDLTIDIADFFSVHLRD